MTVTEICLYVDPCGACEYHIVELDQGEKFAFVWGNVLVRVGQELPAMENTDEKGYLLFDRYEDAVEEWKDVAKCFINVGNGTYYREMMAPLSPVCSECGEELGKNCMGQTHCPMCEPCPYCSDQ